MEIEDLINWRDKMYVYLLQHSHLIDESDDIFDTKIIGIYSSEEYALKVIERYKNIIGFNKYSEDFYIDKYKIDENHWCDGFVDFNI